MINQINLPPEYWYALQEMASEFGYKSRQHLVETALKQMIDERPGAIEKGREILQRKLDIKAGIKRDPEKLKSIMVPSLKTIPDIKPQHHYVFYMKDGTVKEAKSQFPGWALNIAMGREIGLKERDELVRDWEIKLE